MHIKDVQLEKIPNTSKNEISETHYRMCNFCDKTIRISGDNMNVCVRMSGKKFYCPFCIRNNFHHRTSKHVLIMSYRAIFAYYYYRLYNYSSRELYYSQLEKIIDRHCQIGLLNPVLSYDPSTFLWFVDFGKVGSDATKASLHEVKATAAKVLASTEIKKHVSSFAEESIWEKFDKAITNFYKNRQRPKDRKMLIPTFYKIIHNESEEFHDCTRDFVKSHMIFK